MYSTLNPEFSFNGLPVQPEFSHNSSGVDKYKIARPGKAGKIRIAMLLPIDEVTGFWYGSLQPGVKMRLDWNISFLCGAQYQYPVLALVKRNCRCRFGITLDDMLDDCFFKTTLDQEHEAYLLEITIAVSADTGDITLTVDQQDQTIDQLVANWRKSLNLEIPSFPAAAWDPVFCTWYAKHGAVDAAWLEPTAERAVEMGFKTLIVDDGWCYDEYCRVNPQVIDKWYHTIGDYRISQKKFPNFAEHVRKVQSMGMNYMLWVAPHLVGFDSDFYRQHPETVIEPCVEGYRRLKVSDVAARNLMTQRMSELMREGNLDGLKIDFIDIVRPDCDEPNARETLKFAQELSNAVRAAKPDALIEFRQSYTNCAMLKLGTQFRAGDAPFDALKNFGRIAEIRLALGDNIPVHADPAFWSKSDPLECIARHMIAMLGGVPMLSMDLLSLSAGEEKVIRYWLKFYRDHQQLLNHGAWRIELTGQNIAAMTVENDSEKIVLLNDSKYVNSLTDCSKKVIVANLSEAPAEWKSSCASDVCGAAADTSTIPVGGMAVRC